MTPLSFIQRWSRRKLEAAGVPADPPQASASPESLDFGADFSAYMEADIPVEQRTAALRKLFMTDHYRAMDGLDVYVDDYSRPLQLDAMLLGSLAHAGAVLGHELDTGTADTPPQQPDQA